MSYQRQTVSDMILYVDMLCCPIELFLSFAALALRENCFEAMIDD